MTKSYLYGRVELHAGDCLEVLDGLPENSVDAVVCDPPYHFASIVKRFGAEDAAPAKSNGATGVYERASRGFMGKEWDGGDIAFRAETWAKVMRVLKPGGHLVAFAAPKCSHRMVCAIEDAGFEIRDGLMWLFGSGFPKSLDVSKAIDKSLGAERARVRIPLAQVRNPKSINGGHEIDGGDRPWMAAAREAGFHEAVSDEAVSDEAVSWAGWGTALKPAYEPICLARKPLSESTVAANVLRWGTGALNIDACRVPSELPEGRKRHGGGVVGAGSSYELPESRGAIPSARWPANVCHDGSDEVVARFPENCRARGNKTAKWRDGKPATVQNAPMGGFERGNPGDSGSAARFFYCAKASAKDRTGSKHPTVKPIALMRWLVRMVTPPRGVVLDPFSGTGTTGQAAFEEGFKSILIEREAEYRADIEARMIALGHKPFTLLD